MLNKEKFQSVVNALVRGEEVENYLGFECDGFKLNSDKKYVEGIVKGIRRCNLHCPCRVQKIPENICCCTDFIENGHCCCGIWEKVEEE